MFQLGAVLMLALVVQKQEGLLVLSVLALVSAYLLAGWGSLESSVLTASALPWEQVYQLVVVLGLADPLFTHPLFD